MIEGLQEIHWKDVGIIIGSMSGIIITLSLWMQTRFDRAIDKMDSHIQKQAERSDRLYEMFIDLVKERK